MSILGIAHVTLRDGKVDEFLRLHQECRRVVEEKDTGTIRYDVYVDEERTRAIVVEEYEDEAAAVAHHRNIGEELMAAVAAAGEVHGELLGDLSEELRDQLRGGPVTPFLRPALPTIGDEG